MDTVEAKPILVVEKLTKSYAGLHALGGVDFDLRRGEVHAIVGENGAGKSTFIKILGGAVQCDSGRIEWNDKVVHFESPKTSLDAGISIIHQELSVLPKLNIVENIFMGRMPSRIGMVRWKELEKRTLALLQRVGLDIDPQLQLRDLSISQRQLVELAKAISRDARLIIMDEPNSSLSTTESETLFNVIAGLKASGISIIYVSHKIEEVLRISDRVTVFRDGASMGTVNTAAATIDSIIRMMIGRQLVREYIPSPSIGETILEVRGISGKRFKDVSFDVRRGEVLCFAGLVGSGRSEVMRAIFGADPMTAGEVFFEGKQVHFQSPRHALQAGFAMVPEDRKTLSLFLNLAISLNISLARLPNLKRALSIDKKAVKELVKDFFARLSIKARNSAQPVQDLSGGNQQKCVLARWLATSPRVLILDEPTHGIDVGAKSEVYDLIRNLAKSGVAIILISSELPEVIAMADRAVVMHEGLVAATLERSSIDELTIMSYATGTALQPTKSA